MRWTRTTILIAIFLATPLAFATPRIISLAPDLTELVYDLKLEKNLVATTQWSNYPLAANSHPKVGSFIAPHLERILSFKPTTILARTGATPDSVISFLKKEGIEVHTFEGQNETDIFKTIKMLGELFDRKALAQKHVARAKQTLKNLKPLKKKFRVLIQIEENPWMVAGKHTLLDAAIRLAGGINAAGSYEGYPRLQKELFTKLQIDIFVVVQNHPEKQFHTNDTPTYVLPADLLTRASMRFFSGIQKLNELLFRAEHKS